MDAKVTPVQQVGNKEETGGQDGATQNPYESGKTEFDPNFHEVMTIYVVKFAAEVTQRDNKLST